MVYRCLVEMKNKKPVNQKTRKMNSLLNRQNDPDLIKLLLASNVAYTKAKVWEMNFCYLLVFLSVTFPISYVLITEESIKHGLFGISFFLSLIILIIAGNLKNNTSKGAIFKEEFDTALFDLPWKSTIKKLDHTEVSKLSLQYKGKEIKDWYSCNISPSIPRNKTIAILQHSNTSWDIELRETFKNWIISILVLYTIALFSFILILKVDILTTFYIVYSILPLYIYFIELIRGHSSAIKKREIISKLLDDVIRSKKNISISDLRDIQDEIYYTRQESAKVPNFFFRIYRKRMNDMTEDYIESINRAH